MTEVKTHLIPDKLCERAGLGFNWLPGDKLAIYAHKPLNHTSRDQPSDLAPCDARIHEVRLDVLLFHRVVRKLINESAAVFLFAQKFAGQTEDEGTEARIEYIKLSKQYRSIIKACLQNLQEDSAKTTDAEEKQTLLNLIKVFYNIEFLWHLCEILYIDVTPGETVLPQLLEWVQFHFIRCDQRATAMLSGDYGVNTLESGMEAEPDYWETINQLILLGRLDTVRALLRYHSSWERRDFKAAEAAMRSMPVYQVYGGVSATEFNVRWSSWQKELKAKLQAGVFAAHSQLEFSIKLLCGDESAFTEVQCGSWYQHMTAWLLYTEPTVKSFDLCYHAKMAVQKYGGSAALRHTDYVIIALMESDLHLVIKLIEQTTENGWFAAHLTNLLYLCGCLKIVDNVLANVTERLHESLLLDYATLLMGHASLWQVAAAYLDHCPCEGEARLLRLLPRIKLTNEATALKVVQAAKDRNLVDVMCSVSKVMGRRSERRGRLGNALTWALRSQDSAYVTSLANRFLLGYKDSGKFDSTDLLNNLGPCMMVCDRLTFIGKYCEFHQLYSSNKLLEAASLLVSLVEARLAPKWFWLTMLTDSLPLLESSETLFPVSDLYKLMECMEELEDEGFPDMDVKGNLIRLSLAKNLDRALVHNAQEPDETHSEDNSM